MIDANHLFVLAALVFVFGLGSRKFGKGMLTAPLAFVAFGLLLSPEVAERLGFGKLFGTLADEDSGHGVDGAIHLLGEVTLVVVLFSDAAQIQLRSLARGAAMPTRLLLIGMPLTIGLGVGVAWLLFGGGPFAPPGGEALGLASLALLAVMLAPTDAALGQAVVTSEQVPLRIRQSLSAESGLNDGVAVPLVFLFASLASVGMAPDGSHGLAGEVMEHADGHAADGVLARAQCVSYAVEQLTLGPAAGLLVGGLGAWLMTLAVRRGWIEHAYQELAGIALAIIAFVGANLVGGNGFIAAFVAGLVVGNSSKEVCACLRDFAEAEAQLLMLITFFLVGLVLAWDPITSAPWQAWVYGVLSLTLVRMLPVAVSMIGLGLRPSSVLFLGWFGPRGLASVLFAVLVVEELPVAGAETIVQVTLITVLLSVLLHGVTAAPLSRAYARSLKRDGDRAGHELGLCPADPVNKRSLLRDEA